MRGLAGFLLGPLLYLVVMAVGDRALAPLEPTLTSRVAAGALGAVLAVLALTRSLHAPLGRDLAVRLGLVALVGAVLLGGPGEVLTRWAPLHASLLLLASAALGEAFASVIEQRLADASVLVTAAICLALFDVWSVLLGPAASAVSGGFLQRLLLEVPAPGGPQRFIGISDLVMIALLASLARLRGWGVGRALASGWAGLELALVQAWVTRHAAPALPAIGLVFCIAHWPVLRPDAAGWRRTGRWAAGSAVLLGVATVVLQVLRSSPPWRSP